MSLFNVVEVCGSVFSESEIKKIRANYRGSLDKIQEGIDDYLLNLTQNRFESGKLYMCRVPVSILYSDNEYNRIDEISKTRILESLKVSSGFSYKQSGVLVAFLRKDGTLVLTQGNHRASMAYLCMGEDAMLPVSIIVHQTSDERDCIKVESDNFHTDGTRRSNLNQKQKFKGGFCSGDEEYTFLYNLCKEFGISIGGTNKGDFSSRCSFESYQYLMRVVKMDHSINHESTKSCLRVMSDNLLPGDTDIRGYVFLGLFLFQKCFERPMNEVFKNNPNSSFNNFVKFLFQERTTSQFSKQLTTQKDITKGVQAIKCGYYFASRFVGFFNQYCMANQFKISNGRDSAKYLAIPDSSDSWIEMSKRIEPALLSKAKEEAFFI